MKPSLIVHGGAWDIPDEAVEACNWGCHRALEAGWSALSGGGAALDAVEAAIMVLEDEPVFDAGFGSHLNLDGRVECDAIVMNGATLRAGAVPLETSCCNAKRCSWFSWMVCFFTRFSLHFVVFAPSL